MGNLDRLVDAATIESQAEDDLAAILDVCDSTPRNADGARELASLLQLKLSQRNTNVLMHTLTLAEYASKNCTSQILPELGQQSFLSILDKLLNDRNVADKVKARVLELLQAWSYEFQKHSSLSNMISMYYRLKDAGYRFPQPPSSFSAPPKPSRASKVTIAPSSAEEEDEQLRMALAISISENEAKQSQSYRSSPLNPTAVAHPPSSYAPVNFKFSVRALFNFNASESGEISFQRGDIIHVLDDSHPDWWRGEIRNQTGIFPTNYVERIDPAAAAAAAAAKAPAPAYSMTTSSSAAVPPGTSAAVAAATTTAAAPAAEPETVDLESFVLEHGEKIETLLIKLAALDPRKDSLTENVAIQDLYQEALRVRPQLIKILSAYGKKRDELTALKDKLAKASNTYENLCSQRRNQQPQHFASYRPQQPQQNMTMSQNQNYLPDYSVIAPPQQQLQQLPQVPMTASSSSYIPQGQYPPAYTAIPSSTSTLGGAPSGLMHPQLSSSSSSYTSQSQPQQLQNQQPPFAQGPAGPFPTAMYSGGNSMSQPVQPTQQQHMPPLYGVYPSQ